MSLSKISKVTEEAVTFQSHIDGSRHILTPERSIEIQADLLGSDIVMQLDELVALPAPDGQPRGREGAVNLKNARFADDDSPLDAASACPASRDYSKAYLHHLVKSEEILGQVLLSWHNIAFFQALMTALRAAIAEGRL